MQRWNYKLQPNKQQSALMAEWLVTLRKHWNYCLQQMIPLAALYDNPVKDTNKIHLFLAENAQPSGTQQLDITEDVEIVLIPVEKVLERISTGEICVCGTIAALFLGLNFITVAAENHVPLGRG